MVVTDQTVDAVVSVCALAGLGLAGIFTYQVAQIRVEQPDDNSHSPLMSHAEHLEKGKAQTFAETVEKLNMIASAIDEGATSFLIAEYRIIAVFMALFAILLGSVLEHGGWVALAFIVGGVTSIICGYLGMKIAVFANVRTARVAMRGVGPAFVCAVKSGAVMGFSLVALGLLSMYALMRGYKTISAFADSTAMFEAVAGFGLGGSAIALFGRVGGGIYTKAADVGADLVGKVENDIPEDDPRNPAVIADNVGDNVGDIAGMGADLFGSFAESTCAALVIASHSPELRLSWPALCFPLIISSLGLIVSMVTQFFATACCTVEKIDDIDTVLKRQLLISTVLMTPCVFIATQFLPSTFQIETSAIVTAGKTAYTYLSVSPNGAGAAVCMGLWSGMLIGFTTEYYTSHSYSPVREVAESCKMGAATNIIFGLALGYLSCIIPVIAIAATIYGAFTLAGLYGIALAAIGMLSTLSIALMIDAYGPISDNAGGIAEMAGLGEEVRQRTDALDAAGNTTAAIGKGFAIGSACLVSLALFGAFVTRANIAGVNIIEPITFSGLLFGAMLPYAFSAFTMKSVGTAALAMVDEVRRQFREIPGLKEGRPGVKAEYAKCVAISTQASLREMILPACLVIFTPIVIGFVFGKNALAGVLAGSLVSAVQMAISSSNTGGAWDNAKKYIEAGLLTAVDPATGAVIHYAKRSDPHKAAVVGDTVGDPLKDTSGPSLNILMKLMAIISLVFGGAIAEHSWLNL